MERPTRLRVFYRTVFLLLLSLFMVSCGGGGGTTTTSMTAGSGGSGGGQQGSLLPTITSLGPSGSALGSGGFTLTVNGTNFVNGATVFWNNVSRVTTFVSSTQLTAQILDSDVAFGAANPAAVKVQNPASNPGISNVANYSLINPAPVINSIATTSHLAGDTFTLVLNISNFVPPATLHIGSQSYVLALGGPDKGPRDYSYPVYFPTGTSQVTLTHAGPAVGTSNAKIVTGTPYSPAGDTTLVSIDTQGNPTGSYAAMSKNARYVGFSNYVRDTCINAPAGCTPVTRTYAPPPQALAPNVSAVPNSVTGITADGRYILAEKFNLHDSLGTFGSTSLYDTCFNVPSGCQPTSTALDSGRIPNSSMTPNARYALAAQSVNFNSTQTLFDTCAGAPPGCTVTSQTIVSTTSDQRLSMTDDARYIVRTRDAVTTFPTTPAAVMLHDSCVGAAPGCVPSETVLANDCGGGSITGDGQYVAYFCGPPPPSSDLYLQRTCITGGTCDPTPTKAASNVESTEPILSSGARFIAFEQRNIVLAGQQISAKMVMVVDTCNNAPSGCTPNTAPICISSTGEVPSQDCSLRGMSADGKYVLFSTPSVNFATPPAQPEFSDLVYIGVNPLF